VGGNPYFGVELRGLIVANLSGLREDVFIVHTFERYIAEGDPDWPLLFPMGRSAVGARAVARALRLSSPHGTGRFEKKWWSPLGTADGPALSARIRKSSGYPGFFAERIFKGKGLTLRPSTPIRVFGP
jgi:hypothetical protein